MPSKRKPRAHRTRRSKARKAKQNARSFDSLSPRQQDTYTRTIPVLGKMRRGLTFTEAVEDSGTTIRTVLRYFPHDFSKAKGSRRWVVRKSDNHVRFMKDVGDFGMRVVRVHGSVEATQQALFMNDVRRAIAQDDPSGLANWRGKRIGDRELNASLPKIMTFAESGDLSFEDLYAAAME